MALIELTDGDDEFDARARPDWDEIDGKAGNDSITIGTQRYVSGPGNDTIIGTTAWSTVVLRNATAPTYVDLEQGYFLDGQGGRDTLSGVRIVHGSGQPGTFLGSAAPETFWLLRGGGDIVDGRGGLDEVVYWGLQRSDVSIVETVSGEFAVTHSATGRVDLVSNVESLQFDDGRVILASRYANQSLAWTSGDGLLTGDWSIGASADLNGDGLFDLVLADGAFPPAPAAPHKVIVLLQQPDGLFISAQIDYQAPGMVHPREIVFGDLNGDGRTDAFIAGHGWDAVPFPSEPNTVLLNTGDDRFILRYAAAPATADFTHSAALGDIDGDGDLDVYVGNIYGQQHIVPYFLMNASGSLTRDNTRLPASLDFMTGGVTYTSSALVDINGDGELDLVLGSDAYTRTTVFFNDGAGRFSDAHKSVLPGGLFGPDGTISVDVVPTDINRDGRIDLLLSQTASAPFYAGKGIQILVQGESGQYFDETAARMPDQDTRQQWIQFLQLIDYDRDGHLDIVGSFDLQGDRLYLNDGTGTFRATGLAAGFNDTVGGYLLPLQDGMLARIERSGDAIEVWTVEAHAPGLTGPGNTLSALQGAPGFNEDFYLGQHPAVAAGVASGTWASGLAHYLAVGKGLGYDAFAPDTWVFGDAGADVIVLREGDERAFGDAGDDRLVGKAGNDILDGGSGTDTAIYAGARAGFTVAKQGNTFTVTDRTGAEGTDTLTTMEKLQFSDKLFDLVNPPRTSVPDYGKDGGFLFDPVFYLLNNPELVPTVGLDTALQSYLTVGGAQHEAPNSWFNAAYYANKWADLKPLQLDDATLFTHYNLYGVWEGRSGGPKFDSFDGNRYLAENPDVAAYVDANVDDFLGSRSNGAIAHFIIYGNNEQRVAYDTAGAAVDMGYIL